MKRFLAWTWIGVTCGVSVVLLGLYVYAYWETFMILLAGVCFLGLIGILIIVTEWAFREVESGSRVHGGADSRPSEDV